MSRDTLNRLMVVTTTLVAMAWPASYGAAAAGALGPGEYDATLNGVRIHYTVSGSGLVLIAYSGGPGIDARTWGEVVVPTLIIAGRHDFITNLAMAKEMERGIQDARLEMFEASGHFTLVEEPEKFNRVVRGFVVGEGRE